MWRPQVIMAMLVGILLCFLFSPTHGGQAAELLVAGSTYLRRYNLLTKSYTPLIDNKNIKYARATDFHFQEKYVYWTDIGMEDITRVNTETKVIDVVAKQNVKSAEGLAVDWVHGHLYWTDTGMDHVEVASLDGSMRKVLINTDLDKPRAIALHPGKALMFWSDWGNSPKIERCGLNGHHRSSIISEQITWPNGLTIDYVDDRLYWVDAKLNQIVSSDLDGLNRRKILHSPQYLSHPNSITVFEQPCFTVCLGFVAYWSDWFNGSIWRYNKFQTGEVESIEQGLSSLSDVRIFHPDRQVNYTNRCGSNNGGCEHFCLPDPVNNFTCECKTGYNIDPTDAKSCLDATTTFPTTTTTPPTNAPTPTTTTATTTTTNPNPTTRPTTTSTPTTSAEDGNRATTTFPTISSTPPSTECGGKLYGKLCHFPCSYLCGGDGACDKNSGTCVQGCVAGYVLNGPVCEKSDKTDVVTVVASTGSVILLAVLTAAIITCICIRRRRRELGGETDDGNAEGRSPPNNPVEPPDGHYEVILEDARPPLPPCNNPTGYDRVARRGVAAEPGVYLDVARGLDASDTPRVPADYDRVARRGVAAEPRVYLDVARGLDASDTPQGTNVCETRGL